MGAAAPRVLVPGGVLVDLSVVVPELPPRGGDVLASSSGLFVAGAFNVAAAAARQGAATVLGAPVGAGPFGVLARAAAAREGIALSCRSDAELDTGTCIALVEPDGERTMVTVSGAEARLAPSDLDSLAPTASDVVAFSGYDLDYPAAWQEQLRWLEALPTGVRVVFDPSPLVGTIPRDRLDRALLRTDVLTLNTREARLLTAGDATGRTLLDAVLAMVPAHAAVVLRDGAATTLAAGGMFGATPIAVASLPVTVVDSTGAGDAHTGVLCAGLAVGLAPADALRRASAAAGLAVTRRGPATAPTAAELRAVAAG